MRETVEILFLLYYKRYIKALYLKKEGLNKIIEKFT